MTKLQAGQTFSRQRGFRRPAHASNRWWIIGVQNLNGEKITGYGTEYITIDEIVETDTLGAIAIYRQWVVDPDGADVGNHWTPRRDQCAFRPLASLLAAIRTMEMADVTHRPRNNVVRFPIERRLAA
jgi:hypothetical protein